MNNIINKKICPTCNNEFLPKLKKQIFCSRRCVWIPKKKVIRNDEQIARQRWFAMRIRSKKFNGDICSLNEFLLFWKTPHICEYCKVSEENWLNEFKRRLEIDRKESSLGYDLSNIVWACHRCNTIKSNLLSYKEMKEIGEKYIRPKLFIISRLTAF